MIWSLIERIKTKFYCFLWFMRIFILVLQVICSGEGCTFNPSPATTNPLSCRFSYIRWVNPTHPSNPTIQICLPFLKLCKNFLSCRLFLNFAATLRAQRVKIVAGGKEGSPAVPQTSIVSKASANDTLCTTALQCSIVQNYSYVAVAAVRNFDHALIQGHEK